LKDLGDKVPPTDRGSIEAAMSDLKRALGGDDKDVIETKANALAQASAALAQQAYAQAGAGGEGGPSGGEAGGAGAAGGARRDDDVVDAEFEEVKDKKQG
jgi:molecular chaperone DnaK